ncbi:MAG: hypothetical protein SO176_04440 [Bacilli bacterium]|nr:hypothetical protein [Bacilli bacterium]
MKVSKTQAVLLILSMLLEKGNVSKEEIKDMIEVSDLSFKRYMQEIRAFIANFNLCIEVVYNRETNKYYIKNL